MYTAGGITYRPGTVLDFPVIAQMIADSEHHGVIEPSRLGGVWYVAAKGDEVIGCVWCFTDGYNAFWDYLYLKPAFRNGRIALILGRQFEMHLRRAGVRRIISTMKTENQNVIRMAIASGHAVDTGYELGYKELL
jgi:hypothetical protein